MKPIKLFILFLFSFVFVEFLNIIFGRHLNSVGLVPRSLDHLSGILFAPWLHGNIEHALTNFSALFVLAALVWQWGKKVFWKSSLLIILASGLFVWIFARPAYHIGASGLVYGYFGFCIVGGWMSERFYLLLISILVTLFYGSMIWGVLPVQQGTSFEFHLAGFISGVLAAKYWASTR